MMKIVHRISAGPEDRTDDGRDLRLGERRGNRAPFGRMLQNEVQFELVGEAKKELQAKDYASSRRTVRLALAASPEIDGGTATAAAIVDKEYPEVVVAVTNGKLDFSGAYAKGVAMPFFK